MDLVVPKNGTDSCVNRDYVVMPNVQTLLSHDVGTQSYSGMGCSSRNVRD